MENCLLVNPNLDIERIFSEAQKACLAKNENKKFKAIVKDNLSLVNKKDESGWTLLMMAAYQGNDEAVSFLLKNGASTEERDNTGNTPLLTAVAMSRHLCAKMLLEHKAEVNVANSFGLTPIMQACEMGDMDMTKLLFGYSADVLKKDHKNQNALDYALNKKQYSVVNLIESIMFESSFTKTGRAGGVRKL